RAFEGVHQRLLPEGRSDRFRGVDAGGDHHVRRTGRSGGPRGEGAGHQARSIRAVTLRWEALPSPQCGGGSAVGVGRIPESARVAGSVTSWFQSLSRVSTHSVSVRTVEHGVPSRYASFWSPPESVTTARAHCTALIRSG